MSFSKLWLLKQSKLIIGSIKPQIEFAQGIKSRMRYYNFGLGDDINKFSAASFGEDPKDVKPKDLFLLFY